MLLDQFGTPLKLETPSDIMNAINTANALLTRSGLASRLGYSHEGRRDLYNTLGYKRELQFEDYYSMYKRNGFARRIIEADPNDTWSNKIVVKEDDKPDETEFEQAFKELARHCNLWNALRRADILAGIHKYAVIVIGLKGSSDFNAGIQASEARNPKSILYLRPYHDDRVSIKSFETNPSKERYGQPLRYKVEFSNAEDTAAGDGSLSLGSKPVHHTRILHLAEGNLHNDIYGVPRLESIFNRLMDLEKVLGAAGEAFWSQADAGLHVNAIPEMDMTEKNPNLAVVKQNVSDYFNNVQRYLLTQGMDVKKLQAEISDPKGTVDALISEIAAARVIPKRQLIGSEQGQLASAQDMSLRHAYLAHRNEHYAEPLLRTFITKMQTIGVLPPAEYEIVFPPFSEPTPETRARTAKDYAAASRTFVESPAMNISEFRKHALGLPETPASPSENTFTETQQEEKESDNAE